MVQKKRQVFFARITVTLYAGLLFELGPEFFMSSTNPLTVIDTHHHLWDLTANYYPWLTDHITTRVCGDYAAIRRNYLLEDFFERIYRI